MYKQEKQVIKEKIEQDILQLKTQIRTLEEKV